MHIFVSISHRKYDAPRRGPRADAFVESFRAASARTPGRCVQDSEGDDSQCFACLCIHDPNCSVRSSEGEARAAPGEEQVLPLLPAVSPFERYAPVQLRREIAGGFRVSPQDAAAGYPAEGIRAGDS